MTMVYAPPAAAIYGNAEYRVKIGLESRDPDALAAAVEQIKRKIPCI